MTKTLPTNWRWSDLRVPIVFWLIWRLGLFLVGILAARWLPYQPSFPYFDSVLPSFGWAQWLYSWANFDGVHYLTIAEKGYLGTGLIQAFFPVFPLGVVAIAKLTQLDLLMAGLLLNQVFSLVLTCLVWYWLKTTFTTPIARSGLLGWLMFPTSFFLVSFYNESLFVILALSCWLLAKRQRWGWAVLAAALASATRVVGVWLVPLMLIELYQQTYRTTADSVTTSLRHWLTQWKWHIMLLCGGALGLLTYMTYLQVVFNDPLYFLHLQSEFGAGRQESIILWPQVVWRSLKILIGARPFDWKYLTYVQEFLVGMSSILLVIWGFWQRKHTKLTLPLAVYSLGCLLTPTLTGTFSSMPRYVLAAWPLWLVFAWWSQKSRLGLWLALAISLGLLIINTSLFIQGYWVA